MSATPLIVAVLSAVGFLGASLVALGGSGADPRARSLAVAIAAGILLAIAFADLFPEALERSHDAAIFGFAGGFALLLVVETLTRGHTHHSPEEHVHRHPLTPFVIGLAIHNAADGFALGVSAELSVVAAVAVGLGVLVHQVPVGISLAAVLVAADTPRREILRLAGLLALVIPVSALVTSALPTPGDATLGALVGVAGGVLTYMGASHLLPEAQNERESRLPGVAFTVTLAVVTLLLLTVLHG